MSITNKIVSKFNVGTPIPFDDKNVSTIFYELDDTLNLLRTSSGGDIRQTLSTVISDLINDANKDTVASLITYLSIADVPNKILDVLSKTNISDPLMLITGRYFAEDTTSNSIVVNDYLKHLFSFYEFTYENSSASNIKSANVTINDTKFNSFIQFYLPKTYQKIVLLGDLSNIYIYLLKIVFIYSLYLYMEINNNSYYISYEKNAYEKKIEDNLFAYFDIKSEYNFYLPQYEYIFNTNFTYENIIPNYYGVINYLANNTNVVPHVSLGESVAVTKKTIGSQEYFDDIANVVNNSLNNTEFLNYYSSLFNNILVDTKVKEISDISTENFPYINKLSFYNISNDISNYLLDNNLDTLTLNNIYSSFYGLASLRENVLIENKIITKLNDPYGSFTDLNGTKYSKNISTSLESGSLQKVSYDNIYSFINEQPFGFNVLQNNAFKFINNLQSLQNPINVFKYIKLNKFVNDSYEKFNSYDQVYNLNLLNCDTLCYFIEKSNGTRLIQTIGVPTENLEEITYNDTQIIYDKEVTYTVYSCDLVPVIFNEYKNLDFVDPIKLSFNIESKLLPHIFKNKILSKPVKVIDSPPLAPEVKVISYQNVNNAISFLFNKNVGSIAQKPVVIQPGNRNGEGSDELLFNNIQNIQNREDGKILFESDSPINKIQIFYLTTAPTQYLDFLNGNLIEWVYDDGNNSVATITLVPNTRYYFTFRAIDNHNLISNPTDIYEIELVDNDGAIYSLVQTYDFTNKKDYVINKSFRKYLSITPSFSYTDVFQDTNGNVNYGRDDNLWNQKFKVRITSKSSGKAFDVNLTFIKKVQDLT